LKVLLIDDSIDIVDAVSFYCESNQIKCDTLTDGKSGLSAIRNCHYDLVLLDIAMPGFSGLDVLKSLEAEGLLEKKNVVIFTASSDSKMLEELRKSGVREILKKPCSIDDLAELFKRFGPNDST